MSVIKNYYKQETSLTGTPFVAGWTLLKATITLLAVVCLFWIFPFPWYSTLALVSVLVLGASLLVMHHAVGLFHLRNITIPGFYYIVYVLIILLPGFRVYADMFEPYRSWYLFAIESALITVPLGILCIN